MRAPKRRFPPTVPAARLPLHNPAAAGLDSGAAEIWACVPAERDPQPVRAFGTFTPDLHALADWLTQCEVRTVAMESTGVYWIPIYEGLEARGFEGTRDGGQMRDHLVDSNLAFAGVTELRPIVRYRFV